MPYRYDLLQFSTELPNYINIGQVSGFILVHGSVANGATVNFSTTLSVTTGTTFSDIYAVNPNTGLATLLVSLNSINTIYQFVSSEFSQNEAQFGVNSVTVTIGVTNNSGAGISLISQNFQIVAFEYNMPF